MCLCVLSLVKDFQSVCTFMVPGSPSFTTTSKNINTKDCKRQTQEREKNKCIICFEFKIESYTVDSPEFFRGFNFSRCIVFDFFFLLFFYLFEQHLFSFIFKLFSSVCDITQFSSIACELVKIFSKKRINSDKIYITLSHVR